MIPTWSLNPRKHVHREVMLWPSLWLNYTSLTISILRRHELCSTSNPILYYSWVGAKATAIETWFMESFFKCKLHRYFLHDTDLNWDKSRRSVLCGSSWVTPLEGIVGRVKMVCHMTRWEQFCEGLWRSRELKILFCGSKASWIRRNSFLQLSVEQKPVSTYNLIYQMST